MIWVLAQVIRSARRLPDGNALIDEGMDGRVFQIAPHPLLDGLKFLYPVVPSTLDTWVTSSGLCRRV